MAKATKDVERVVTEKVTVTLSLSDDEARVLVIALAKIGGDAAYTARKHTDAIHNALLRAGVPSGFENRGIFSGVLMAEEA